MNALSANDQGGAIFFSSYETISKENNITNNVANHIGAIGIGDVVDPKLLYINVYNFIELLQYHQPLIIFCF